MSIKNLTNNQKAGKLIENRGKKKLIKRLIKQLEKEIKYIDEETEELLTRYQEE